MIAEYQNLDQICQALKEKKISPPELLKEYFNKIKKYDTELGAFIELEEEIALKEAKESEQRRNKQRILSEYDGIPIGVKDNIVREDCKIECASRILQGYVSPFSATVIDRLKSKGFITIGRLNMDEFAMGSSTENSSIRQTKNPFDLKRTPGGSSGGSACAVASGMLPAALGSDTGGSIRQPASFCGIVGLKPTYGMVSRYGLVAFASSLDQIGPFTKCVLDNEILFNIIKGEDPLDSTSIPERLYRDQLTRYDKLKLSELKIGYPPDLVEKCEENVKASFYQAIESLKKLGTDNISQIEMPYQDYAIATYYITATSEASSNLARFDGMRYGKREGGADLQEVYENSKTLGFGPEVKRRILLGTFALSSGYYDAYYLKAQKVRTLMQRGYQEIFKKVHLILLPTTSTEPFMLGERIEDPLRMYLSDELTVTASLAGIPAMSIPAPFTKLPIGLQIQAPYFAESLIFFLAKEIEKNFPSPSPNTF